MNLFCCFAQGEQSSVIRDRVMINFLWRIWELIPGNHWLFKMIPFQSGLFSKEDLFMTRNYHIDERLSVSMSILKPWDAINWTVQAQWIKRKVVYFKQHTTHNSAYRKEVSVVLPWMIIGCLKLLSLWKLVNCETHVSAFWKCNDEDPFQSEDPSSVWLYWSLF